MSPRLRLRGYAFQNSPKGRFKGDPRPAVFLFVNNLAVEFVGIRGSVAWRGSRALGSTTRRVGAACCLAARRRGLSRARVTARTAVSGVLWSQQGRGAMRLLCFWDLTL